MHTNFKDLYLLIWKVHFWIQGRIVQASIPVLVRNHIHFTGFSSLFLLYRKFSSTIFQLTSFPKFFLKEKNKRILTRSNPTFCKPHPNKRSPLGRGGGGVKKRWRKNHISHLRTPKFSPVEPGHQTKLERSCYKNTFYIFFLRPSPPQYIRDKEWSDKFNLIPVYNKNKIGKLHKFPSRSYEMIPTFKNYGTNDIPSLEVCINITNKFMNTFCNEIFHFKKIKIKVPMQTIDEMILLPIRDCTPDLFWID